MKVDLEALKRLAEGNGDDRIRVTKRWLRSLIAQIEAETTNRGKPFDFGTLFPNGHVEVSSGHISGSR